VLGAFGFEVVEIFFIRYAPLFISVEILSAKGAKCKSLGRRPRIIALLESLSTESAESQRGGRKDGPVFVRRPNSSIFSTKNRETFITAAIEKEPLPGPLAQTFTFRAFGA